MSTRSIYALVDPRDNKIFYVGATDKKLKARLRSHVYNTKKAKNEWSVANKKKEFIDGIIADGKFPEIIELEHVDVSVVDEREEFHYNKYKSLGCNLIQSKSFFNYTTKIRKRYFNKK